MLICTACVGHYENYPAESVFVNSSIVSGSPAKLSSPISAFMGLPCWVNLAWSLHVTWPNVCSVYWLTSWLMVWATLTKYLKHIMFCRWSNQDLGKGQCEGLYYFFHPHVLCHHYSEESVYHEVGVCWQKWEGEVIISPSVINQHNISGIIYNYILTICCYIKSFSISLFFLGCWSPYAGFWLWWDASGFCCGC